jgi:hypothetical protein
MVLASPPPPSRKGRSNRRTFLRKKTHGKA